MSEALEQSAVTTIAGDSELLWESTSDWGGSDEAPTSDLWEVLATPVTKRRGVASSFASAVKELPGVHEVWVTDLESDLDVAIALDDLTLESKVRNVFIDLVCERLDASEGELFVFHGEKVPDWVQNGERLI